MNKDTYKKRLINIFQLNKFSIIIIMTLIILFTTLQVSAVNEPNWNDLNKKSLNNLEENPENIKANYNYLISLVNMGEIEAAYNTIKDLEDNFDEKKFVNTISPYFKELVKHPEDVLLLNYAAFYGILVKEYDISIKYFNKILNLTPHNYNIRNFLAATYIELEKYEIALKETNKALESKNNEFSHLLLGVIYYERGNILKAITEFSKSGNLGREILNMY